MVKTQRIHDKAYLINTVVELAGKTSLEVGVVPRGAIIEKVDLEVIELSDATDVSVGLGNTSGYFISKGSVTAVGNIAGTKTTQTLKDESITLSQTGTATKGKVAVRVLFFTPSTYLAEF
ncbi:hypothetical protein [Campylobacter hyointestinalis]|uniref:DUF2190 family protein n=1 Tax=Campylobacter hyointestinalis subsp. hyointestinalis TaxID=91352 RepID=A0A9W5ANC1_CAMHY|nr:hypothetical protein [Campylobacter hyointestinalis]CUU74606.1 Uncharacterised protein [Campylobacter hyointestinalis subsp. hyointestinalis]CUU82413.1 Uncharacterised protein [Campylobacter hyointestinalis subsp. hyointestinalis]